MFPHDKLDWSLRRLEQKLEEHTDDASLRLEFARSALSRAMFHAGGEVWFNRALTQARRVLQQDPASVGALVVAGLSLVGLDRLEPATRYLDEALRVENERADVHLGQGALLWRQGQRHQAIHELEAACRLDANSWEAHSMLGQLLAERADELGGPQRLLERSQFHVVRALELGCSATIEPVLLQQLGVACLRTGRLQDAHKLFTRLLEHKHHRSRARYYVGLVAYHMGKYKNAILNLRQYLEERPDAHHVHSRIAMAYLHLGEVAKAREACNRALAIDPGDLQARWTLGCAWLEEGQVDEAVRMFRSILSDAPDHLPAFTELVRLNREAGWLRAALRAEVGGFDKLPPTTMREHPGSHRMVEVRPRDTTRERIRVLLNAMRETETERLRSGGQRGPAAVPAIIEAMDITLDEGLRFMLWEAALEQLAINRSHGVLQQLRAPGLNYDAALGREALTLSRALPPAILVAGLQIGEGDLKRAAVDRHPPTRNVADHRVNIDKERQTARAWQALLLLALSSHDDRGTRNLLVRWASDADPELADVARAGLVVLGDDGALDALRQSAAKKGAADAVDELSRRLAVRQATFTPRPVSDDPALVCSTCGRTGADADHMMLGRDAILCNHCTTAIALDRMRHKTEDPSVHCRLTGHTLLDERALYEYRGIAIAASVVDNSLGLQEREEVDRYLSAW